MLQNLVADYVEEISLTPGGAPGLGGGASENLLIEKVLLEASSADW